MILLAFNKEKFLRMRKAKKLSLAQLANNVFEKTNHYVTPQNLHSIETGKSQPSDPLIKAIAQYFDKPERFFLSKIKSKQL